VEGLGIPTAISIQESGLWQLRPVAAEDEEAAAASKLDVCTTSEIRLMGEDGTELMGGPLGESCVMGLQSENTAGSSVRPSVSEVVGLMDTLQNLRSSEAADAKTSSGSRWCSIQRGDTETALFGDIEGIESGEKRKPLLQDSPAAGGRGTKTPPEEASPLHMREQSIGSMTITSSAFFPAMSAMTPGSLGGTEAGGSWSVAWQLEEGPSASEQQPSMKRIVILAQEDSRHVSTSFACPSEATEQDSFPALVFVSHAPAETLQQVEGAVGPAMMHPAELAKDQASPFALILEPGVLRALFVGMGLQALQQVRACSPYPRVPLGIKFQTN